MTLKYYLYIGVLVALIGLAFTVRLQHTSIENLKEQNKQFAAHIESINKSIVSLEELRDNLGEVNTKTIIIEKEIRNLPDEGLEEEANKISDQIFERFNR